MEDGERRRRDKDSLHMRSEMQQKYTVLKSKKAGEVANRNQIIESIKAQEKNHEFFNLVKLMERGVRKHIFDHKRIEEIKERDKNAMKIANRYQQENIIVPMREISSKGSKGEGLDLPEEQEWDFQSRFQKLKAALPQRNQFFNNESISKYIKNAFKGRIKKPEEHLKLPSLGVSKHSLVVADRTHVGHAVFENFGNDTTFKT